MNKMENNGLNRGLSSNPADLQTYRKKQYPGNTTPAGVEQPMVVLHFYKQLMPLASSLPLTSLPTSVNGNRSLDLLPLALVNGKETACLTTGLQPHSMWLKPLILMKSANRLLKQPACPDFSGAIKQRAIKQPAPPDFSGAIEIHNQMCNFEPLKTQHERKIMTQFDEPGMRNYKLNT